MAAYLRDVLNVHRGQVELEFYIASGMILMVPYNIILGYTERKTDMPVMLSST